MNKRKHIAALVVVLLSIFFGLSKSDLAPVSNWINPPKAGLARVEEVMDGDTILVRFGSNTERVRLIGVDTPETHHPNKAVQCYGEAASNFLHKLLDGEDVRLEADPTNTNRDRYDRLLRYVYTEDEELVNQKIIQEGYGFAYVGFPFEKKSDFKTSQEFARDQNLGLWKSCDIDDLGDGRFNTAPASDAY